jgi:hypothetical protein
VCRWQRRWRRRREVERQTGGIGLRLRRRGLRRRRILWLWRRLASAGLIQVVGGGGGSSSSVGGGSDQGGDPQVTVLGGRSLEWVPPSE